MLTNAPHAVAHAEWVKIRSVRSTVLVLVVTTVAMTVLAAASGASVRDALDNDPSRLAEPAAEFDPVTAGFGTASYIQLGLMAFGVLLAGGEYSSGMIRTSLTAVPQRGLLFAAKAAACAATAAVVSGVATVAAFLAQQAGLGAHGVGLDHPGALRGVLLTTGYLTLITLLALGLATLLRSTALTLGILYLALFAYTPLSYYASALERLVDLIPYSIATALVETDYSGPGGSRLGGLLIVSCWTGAALLAGWLSLRRRDA